MFVLRMAWREIRSSWTRLVFFFLCVAIGVAAIVAVRSVIQEVRHVLTSEARALVGADMVVQTGRPWTEDVQTRLNAALARTGVTSRMEVIETPTMAASDAGQVRLVELRAVEAGFPYYGAPTMGSGAAFSHDLLRDRGIVVQPELLLHLGVGVGDTIRLAGQPFVIRDTIVKDQVQGRGGFALGPRVYLDIAALRETTILQFGSRASYQWYVRVEDPALGGLTADLRRGFRRDLVSVRSWRTIEDRLGRNLTLAENYLSLVGFAMVVLGGIGVWSVTRVFIQQKIKSVAVLKCVGATSRQMVRSVLGGTATGTYLGKVAVARDAQQTDSEQDVKAMLLNRSATANAKPELEIFADDVKCAHGCAIGELDAMALYYLQSRGLPPGEAKKLMLQAFVAGVFDGAEDEEQLQALALAKLGELV